ncbi:hypothetical protein KKG72_11565 [bacterium]|nr:hypothetical protein [bacterium]MBU1994722.1 hypothetical protein [bacterium]
MQISSVNSPMSQTDTWAQVKNLYTGKLSQSEAKELREIVTQNANVFTFKSIGVQSNSLSLENKFEKDYKEFQDFLNNIGYEGKNIAELSQNEAAALVSEDGFFGISKTSQRIADFVLSGANGNEDLLRAGREGVLRGFNEAQALWGEKLPDISQITMAKTIEMIDMAINELGFSILNKEV